MFQRILSALGLRAPSAETSPSTKAVKAIIEAESESVLRVRGSLNKAQGELDALTRKYGGRRKGLFNKQWLLPNDVLAEVMNVLPQARIDPIYRESLERHVLSFAQQVDGPSLAPKDFGITLYPFQEAAIEYLLRAQQAVLGDEAGVGKTFPAIAAAHRVKQGSVIVICPANLKLNWVSEIKRARPDDSIYVCYGRTPTTTPTEDWIILNYDIATGWVETLRGVQSNVVILDEIHNCKNPGAQRSEACLRIAEGRPYRFGLTGTLFRNRHAEAFYQLRIIGQLPALGGYTHLLQRFCGGKESGSINSQSFNRLLRSHCYMRREKRAVLAQLPAKTRSHLVVELNGAEAYQKQERGLLQWLLSLRSNPANPNGWKTNTTRMDALGRVNQLRQLAGIGKVPAAIEWIKDFLDQTDEKLVVFAYHRAVQQALVEAFPQALHLMADDNLNERQASKEAFQTQPAQRLILCSLGVASEGITLTAASTMLCLELDYVPAKLFDQMEGRIDRNGQTRPIQVYYMLAENSIDQRMMTLLESKWRTVTAANTGQDVAAGESIFDELVEGWMREEEARVAAQVPKNKGVVGRP